VMSAMDKGKREMSTHCHMSTILVLSQSFSEFLHHLNVILIQSTLLNYNQAEVLSIT
jgi:hypothetical protein